jgi:hypothetical protein
LPTPASPTIDTTPVCPSRTICVAASSIARSLIRPTNGTSDRRARAPAADAPVTNHDCST